MNGRKDPVTRIPGWEIIVWAMIAGYLVIVLWVFYAVGWSRLRFPL